MKPSSEVRGMTMSLSGNARMILKTFSSSVNRIHRYGCAKRAGSICGKSMKAWIREKWRWSRCSPSEWFLQALMNKSSPSRKADAADFPWNLFLATNPYRWTSWSRVCSVTDQLSGSDWSSCAKLRGSLVCSVNCKSPTRISPCRCCYLPTPESMAQPAKRKCWRFSS